MTVKYNGPDKNMKFYKIAKKSVKFVKSISNALKYGVRGVSLFMTLKYF